VAALTLACPPAATVDPEPAPPSTLDAPVIVDPGLHHVGDERVADWSEIATAEPEAASYERSFMALPNQNIACIELVQRGVQAEWTVRLGDVELGMLPRRREERVAFFDIPAHALTSGENRLTVISDNPADDIVIGQVTVHPNSTREVLDARHSLGDLTVTVVDPDGAPLPARLSLVDPSGETARLYGTNEHAVRPGIAYTDGSGFSFALPAGAYEIAAMRGTEWSRATERVEVVRGETSEIRLELRREVDTTGWIAADTHIHTLTYAHHGDALIDERMLSLAGEGIELAIATDHNHNVDYLGPREAAGMSAWFTPVTGNEVTTPAGHFNAFPLDPEGAIPPYESTDWPTLVDGMRDAGARIVILNHPHWPAVNRGPFAFAGVHPHSGARWEQLAVTFDAIEIVNSGTLDPDPMPLLSDWFALVNRGEAPFGVGSSDSHTIGEPVGQGRTYVHAADDAPGALDVESAIQAFERGDTSVSLGIFAALSIDGSSMGSTIRRRRGPVRAALRVATPSWVTAQRVLFVVNGAVVDTVELAPVQGPRDQVIERDVDLPAFDAWVGAIVLGEGIDLPGWRTEAAYTLAVANPIFVDRDRSEGWTPPRQSARDRLKSAGSDLRAIERAIERADPVLRPFMREALRARVDAFGDGDDSSLSTRPHHDHAQPAP
jgi:hypothetical protein